MLSLLAVKAMLPGPGHAPTYLCSSLMAAMLSKTAYIHDQAHSCHKGVEPSRNPSDSMYSWFKFLAHACQSCIEGLSSDCAADG